MAAPALPKLPLIGSDAQFAALRSALQAADYTDAGVCRRVGIKKIFDFRLEGETYIEADSPDALGKLIRLMLECGPVTRAEGDGIPWKELEALDLVMPDPSNSGQWVCTSLLYPELGMLIASDRTRALGGQSAPMSDAEDVVYPGIVLNTGLFLSLVPFTPCDSFLDLCAGTGVAALAAARGGALHSYAYDLTARSTHFAEFNRKLNGLENMTAAQGDLYDPAGELTFDRIAVHPPYLPVFRPHAIFDSGGQDGEQIVRRIIEGLPRYLRPGGRFYALTMGTDRQKPFEHRVREWLGETEGEFDVALVVRRVLNPIEYVPQAVVQYHGTISDIPQWLKFFEGLGVLGLVYGFLTIQRRAERRPVFTVRRQLGPQSGLAEHQWLVDWETAVVRASPADLLAMRPKAREGVSLHVTHKLEGQRWVADSYRFETRHPFDMEMNAQAWAGYLMQLADGSLTGTELLEGLKKEGALAPDAPAEEFVKVLVLMVSGGFLGIG